jgi:agmatinase
MQNNNSRHALNFLGLDEADCAYESARFVILPVPYEQSTTYRKGTIAGPQAIISASQEVELFDQDLNSEPFRAGVHTLPELDVKSSSSEQMVNQIYAVSKKLLADNKIICMLGGEHSISAGLVKAYHEKFPDLSVLQLDAHADLRESYQDNRYSHACAMKRIRDIVSNTVGIGIRNMSIEEYELIKREKIKIISGRDINENPRSMDKALEWLSNNIYLTIDCDFFDPSITPAVGTPEPGGGLWYPTLEFLQKLFVSKNVVGFDVVELSPLPVNNISEFTAAKLIYKIMGYIQQKKSF